MDCVSCTLCLFFSPLTFPLPLSSPCRGVFDIVVSGTCVGQYNNKGSFGELALMYNTPRAATIVATQDGALWGLVRIWTQTIWLVSSRVWVKYLRLLVFRCLRTFFCCQVSPFVKSKSSPCCHVLGHHSVGEGSDMLRMESHYPWMEPVLCSDPLRCCSAPLWLHKGLPGAATGPQQWFHLLNLFIFVFYPGPCHVS